MKDYYYILGVTKNASPNEIKGAYRKLSKKFHPDLNDGDIFFEQRFKEIQEAYESLINNANSTNYENRESTQEEIIELPKIIVFESDKNIYNVGSTIKLSWASINGSIAALNLFGKVDLIGEKRIIIKEQKDKLELVLTVKNNLGQVSKSIFIDVRKVNKASKKDIMNINYWYLLIPVIIAFFVFKGLNKDNHYQDNYNLENINNNIKIENENTKFQKFYSLDPMFDESDNHRLRLFNKPYSLLQNYYDSFISAEKVSNVKKFYSETVLIHHNDKIISEEIATQKDIDNFYNEGIESFMIFVQPYDMITDFYQEYDISSTSVNFYIKKVNGKQVKISKKIYTILNKDNTEILGISSKEINPGIIERIIIDNRLNDDGINIRIADSGINMNTGDMPYKYCYGNGYACNNNCSKITIKVSGDADVIAIIKKDGQVYSHIFIEKGNSYSFSVPTGNYQPFFYSGTGWDSNKFISNVECGELIGGFLNNESMGKDDVQYLNNNILTYELIPQRNGNFNTKASNKNEMF